MTLATSVGTIFLYLLVLLTKQLIYFEYIEVCLKTHWQYVSHNKDSNVERLHRADEVKSRLNRACFGVPGGLPCPRSTSKEEQRRKRLNWESNQVRGTTIKH
jgi:hypothetical protein